MWLLPGDLSIVFFFNKESFTEAVPTGTAKYTFVRIIKFGHTFIELVDNSFNCCRPSVSCYIPSESFPLKIHCSMQTTNFSFTVMCNMLVLDSI